MVTPLFRKEKNFVTRPTVAISEYSEKNGGCDDGTLFGVEVLYPDGTYDNMGFFRDLSEAKSIAAIEVKVRGAALMEQSPWPNRKVTAG